MLYVEYINTANPRALGSGAVDVVQWQLRSETDQPGKCHGRSLGYRDGAGTVFVGPALAAQASQKVG